jgi:hypothetical protein
LEFFGRSGRFDQSRSAKPVNAPNPAEIKRKKLGNERRRLFGKGRPAEIWLRQLSEKCLDSQADRVIELICRMWSPYLRWPDKQSLLVSVLGRTADKTRENGPGVGRGRLRFTPRLQKLPGAGSERPADARATKSLMSLLAGRSLGNSYYHGPD